MRTNTLVQATADIITVVSLKVGDVYKRLQENSYGEKYEVKFGIVQDVMHNGEDAVITAMEFTANYSGVEPAFKVFGTGSELRLFSAQPDEVRHHFDEIIEASEKAVDIAEKELAKKRETMTRVFELVERESERALTAPATTALEIVS